jgi:putative molybdopterin biosynthesis protein
LSTVEILDKYDQVKALADPRRLAILRSLLAEPASLTQLGIKLGQHPARIRHHVQKLEETGLVEIFQVTVTKGVTEKFYRTTAGAFLIQKMVLPRETNRHTIIFSGSHDLALEQLSRELEPHVNFLSLPVGSLDGLVALRQGFCHVAGSHLLDKEGDYNTPFVRHLLPDRNVYMVTLAYRQQGLILAQGNPKGIHQITDLVRQDINFINRQPGSGTRLWLDSHLGELGISSDHINGYSSNSFTHSQTASMIKSGQADVGIGLEAAARMNELFFVPLFKERFDLIMQQESIQLMAPLLDHLQTAVCRKAMAGLGGYDTAHTGEQIYS